MKNIKERTAFVEDINNWELTESTIWTQTLKLTYEGHEWYQIRILEYGHHYDYKQGRPYDAAKWENHSRYYKQHSDVGLEPMSKSQVIDEIKDIDRKAREKK